MNYDNLKKILEDLSKSSFDIQNPIPISALFYNADTLEFLFMYKNKNTIGFKREEKYLNHAEYLGVNSDDFNNLNPEIRVGVLITIPPCRDCYTELAKHHNIVEIEYITHRNGVHKLYKIKDLIRKGVARHISVKRHEMLTQEEKDIFEEHIMSVKKIELWMKNS